MHKEYYCTVDGHDVYKIENFYENPGMIFDEILGVKPALQTKHLDSANINKVINKDPSIRDKNFIDLRHSKKNVPIVIEKADALCELFDNQFYHNPKVEDESAGHLQTNLMQWRSTAFNTYNTHYWWPHYDYGWTCIVYLNAVTTNGTNLYQLVDETREEYEASMGDEHMEPWKTKERFKLAAQLEPAFNRAYVYKSGKVLHGAAVDDQTYFEHNNMMRLNQVFFFNSTDGDNT
jgi:hypothetical protein